MAWQLDGGKAMDVEFRRTWERQFPFETVKDDE